jgi:hypothetical protein
VSPQGFAVVKLDLASIEARLGSHAMSIFLGEDWFVEQYRKSDKFNVYLHVAGVCADERVTKKHPIYQAYKHGCLGIQYGVGINTFHKTLVDKFNLPYTLGDCERIYQNIRKTFPVFSKLQRAVTQIVECQGYVSDDFGARYFVPRSEAYKSVNYYCQGCAGGILKWWWEEVYQRLSCGDYIFNNVHDELDMAIKRGKGSKARVKLYCDVLEPLSELFEMPIIAEASGLKNNWGECE